ncbi:hypothetical protein LEP1GSC150_4725 [Leptospira interrogans serovar Copenhageni str. LT2050]|uniref:Uncharacterized protein n=1 Tax=Leptospira interrogans serovar Copenhageni str. LT2050 TaxID=1001598 RepID=M3HPJ1_LEPIT|nr:hypothetical protein LEP1GSC150_4725 [Leptospira interrogans serovar Copenhageni str. LT2050]
MSGGTDILRRQKLNHDPILTYSRPTSKSKRESLFSFRFKRNCFHGKN